MGFTVTNQRTQNHFAVLDNETILDAALRDRRMVPYGCRNGVCGACKCDLISGSVDYGRYEDYALSQSEIASGKVLLCQAIPQQDVVIEVEEFASGENIQIKILPCRVNNMEQLAEHVMAVYLQLPKTKEFHYIAGQYIDIIMKNGQRRSFSISNLPDEARQTGLELHIRYVAGGQFTPQVFGAMKERDLLRFEGPFGSYLWRSDPDTPIILVAGGTGFAPIKGLIQQAMQQQHSARIHLFWGARDQQDLYMHQLATHWQATWPEFSYTPVLSGQTAADWPGETGWVHESVLRHYDDVAEHDVYASGPPVMIRAVRDGLGTKNLREQRFFFDSFDYASPA